jgi:alkylhydroperoxidase family enzyme
MAYRCPIRWSHLCFATLFNPPVAGIPRASPRSADTLTEPRGEARVPRLPVDEAKAAADEAGVPNYMAELAIFQVLLNHPKLACALNDLLATMLWRGKLDPRLRELLIIRIGWLTASDYEWTQHWRVAQGLGVSADDLLGVRDWSAHEAFGPAERAVLSATDDVVRDGAVSAESWAACQREFDADPAVLVELVTAIGAWRMVASILHSLQVPLEDGVASWPPDGQSPTRKETVKTD